MKIKTADAFDQYAKDYDDWFEGPAGRVLFPVEIKALKLVMKNDLKPPFLEVGIGTGIFASVLGIPFGIDPASNMLRIARMRGIGGALARGEELPFRDNTIGTVFVLFTFCFVENPLKVLKEAKRVLSPGGRVVIGILNKKSRWGEFYSKKKKAGHPIYSKARFFSYSDILELLDEVNLKIIKSSSTLLQPPSENPYNENPEARLLPDAGFICLSAGDRSCLD